MKTRTLHIQHALCLMPDNKTSVAQILLLPERQMLSRIIRNIKYTHTYCNCSEETVLQQKQLKAREIERENAKKGTEIYEEVKIREREREKEKKRKRKIKRRTENLKRFRCSFVPHLCLSTANCIRPSPFCISRFLNLPMYLPMGLHFSAASAFRS